MIDYQNFTRRLLIETKSESIQLWFNDLAQRCQDVFYQTRNGNVPRWLNTWEKLPDIKPSSYGLSQATITVGALEDCSEEDRCILKDLLLQLKSWRKGPYHIFGIDVDAEWRSDLKWDRLEKVITSLENRKVMDLGCGNGYHCWRMLGAGAKQVVGFDPTLLYALQFQVFQKYIQHPDISVLPIGVDDIPKNLKYFDTAFCMGLLYHLRSPFHLLELLHSSLRSGGELVLETLVIEGKGSEVLVPEGRYAQMSNVWFIPTCEMLELWLKKCKFKNIRLIDVTKTTEEEQRVTPWFGNQSLNNFLDPQNVSKTIEGHPAPRRAIFLANV